MGLISAASSCYIWLVSLCLVGFTILASALATCLHLRDSRDSYSYRRAISSVFFHQWVALHSISSLPEPAFLYIASYVARIDMGVGVREDVYARPIWLARPPSPDVGTGPITFTYGHLAAFVLGDFRAAGVEK